ncbi:MAG: hypothetical protein ACE5HC_16395 [Candidatus Binatia bacterium]
MVNRFGPSVGRRFSVAGSGLETRGERGEKAVLLYPKFLSIRNFVEPFRRIRNLKERYKANQVVTKAQAISRLLFSPNTEGNRSIKAM